MRQKDSVKKNLVESILELEVKMFLRVPTGEEPSCRSDIESMKLHRSSQFAGWSVETCESYLDDLKKADQSGRNLLTLKYARMDNQIPPLTNSTHLAAICNQYVEWQLEFIRQYPNIMRRGRSIDDFKNYLSSELETYSNKTLDLLWTDVEACRHSGGNLSLDTYKYLAVQAGFKSLEDMENNLS